MSEPSLVEYRVRKVERFIVTRHWEAKDGKTGGTDAKGEYDSGDLAQEVACALCKDEHTRLQWPIDDVRIQYPKQSNWDDTVVC